MNYIYFLIYLIVDFVLDYLIIYFIIINTTLNDNIITNNKRETNNAIKDFNNIIMKEGLYK